MKPFQNLAGRVFGDWTVIGKLPAKSHLRGTRWLCQCVCGVRRRVLSSSLTMGRSAGCSCRQYAELGVRKYKHGHSAGGRETKTYQTWKHMNVRCFHKTSKDYPYYGGRGITVCERWRDYANFLADMGEKPDGLTIERVNNNGNYEPGNCCWATMKEQNTNRRRQKSWPQGAACGASKLTEKQVLKIRALKGKLSQREIGKRFSVTQTNVSFIHRGVTWRNAA